MSETDHKQEINVHEYQKLVDETLEDEEKVDKINIEDYLDEETMKLKYKEYIDKLQKNKPNPVESKTVNGKTIYKSETKAGLRKGTKKNNEDVLETAIKEEANKRDDVDKKKLKTKVKVYNENTIKKDVGVLLQNYVLPIKANSFEDYNTILMDLDLISTNDGKTFQFNIEGKRQVPWQIFLYAIIVVKGADETVDYNTLQEIGLIFCMSDLEVMEMCQSIEANNPQSIRYSDTAGIRQIQFIKKMNAKEVLNEYYG